MSKYIVALVFLFSSSASFAKCVVYCTATVCANLCGTPTKPRPKINCSGNYYQRYGGWGSDYAYCYCKDHPDGRLFTGSSCRTWYTPASTGDFEEYFEWQLGNVVDSVQESASVEL